MQKKGDEGNINEKINNTLTANLNEKKIIFPIKIGCKTHVIF